MDITIQNDSSTPAYLDLYYIMCRKDSISSAATDFSNIDTTKWAGESAINVGTLGIAPYDSSDFTHHWVIKKHRRILLPAGQSTEVSLSDSKRRYYDSDMAPASVSATFCSLKGWTSGLLIQVEGATLDATNKFPEATSIRWFMTKTYSVSICPGFTPVTTGLVP